MRNRGYLARPEKSKSCSTRMYSEGILAFRCGVPWGVRQAYFTDEPRLATIFEYRKVSYLYCIVPRGTFIFFKNLWIQNFKFQNWPCGIKCVATASFETWYVLWKQVESLRLMFSVNKINTLQHIPNLHLTMEGYSKMGVTLINIGGHAPLLTCHFIVFHLIINCDSIKNLHNLYYRSTLLSSFPDLSRELGWVMR